MDDLDRIICHEEFASLVALAEKLKKVRKLREELPKSTGYFMEYQPSTSKSTMPPNEVLEIVERLRERYSFPSVNIRRGMYPLTDAMMDDNFTILQRDLEICQEVLRMANDNTNPIEHRSPVVSGESSDSQKFSKRQQDILLRWFVKNHPVSSMTEKETEILASQTGLAPSQVSAWFKDILDSTGPNTSATTGTKNEKSFLDFLFLAGKESEASKGQEIDAPNASKDIDRNKTPPSSIHEESNTQREQRSGAPDTPVSLALTSPSLPTISPMSMPSFEPASAYSKRGKKRPSTAMEYNSQDWNDNDIMDYGLNAITESFDETEDCLSLDPVMSDSDLDDSLLSIFATTWEASPSKVATPCSARKRQNQMETPRSLAKSVTEGCLVYEWDQLNLSPIPLFLLNGA